MPAIDLSATPYYSMVIALAKCSFLNCHPSNISRALQKS